MASASVNQKIRRAHATARSRPATQRAGTPAEPRETTLLELVQVVAETTDNEKEIVAVVLHMLRSGSVRLMGNFRHASIDLFSR